MLTKRDTARQFIKEGKYKEAMKIVKTFDKIYTKDEMRILQIAYECMSGKEAFYCQIGEDVEKIKKLAISLLLNMILAD